MNVKNIGSPSTDRIPLAIGLLSLSFLLWEILLSRLYSVLLYYYFAFAVISLAMLGLAIGSSWVALSDIPEDKVQYHLSRHAFWTSIGMNAGILLMVIFSPSFHSLSFVWRMIALFSISSFPCITAGKFICLAMTRQETIALNYSANMLGAGLACLMVGGLLSMFGGPAAVCVAALPAAIASVILSRNIFWHRGAWAIGISLICAILFALNPGGKFQLQSGAGYPATRPLFERWNSFSRVAVFKFPMIFNWGISPLIEKAIQPAEQLQLEVDCGSMTPLTRFDGRLEFIQYLKHDITAFAHHLRPHSKVLVIGPGGGRDILASLVFNQPEIHAAEINPAVREAVNNRFGDFTGHLDRLPQVHYAVSEGRNYIERSKQLFDIIVISLVDTWSASAAGAFAFIENGLYTVEAWKTLLSHLTPGGILSLTRWYYGTEPWPVNIIRACILGMETLEQMGVVSPERCIVVLSLPRVDLNQSYVGTVLISPRPFSDADISILDDQCRNSGCEIAYSWKKSADTTLSLLMSQNRQDFINSSPVDISPVTDDRPYFQFYDRLFEPNDPTRHQIKMISPGGQTLKTLLLIFTVVCFCLIAIPTLILIKNKNFHPSNPTAYAIYFSLIGLSYIFVELALIQRFSLFLGHPSFGFTVVLFGLLTSSAGGSLLSQKIIPRYPWFLLLISLIGSFSSIGHAILQFFIESNILLRVLLTLALILPMGFLMGLYLPWGFQGIRKEQVQFSGWCWAINCSMSVMGAVVGTISLISFGETLTLRVAAVLYALSWILLTRFHHKRPDSVNQ